MVVFPLIINGERREPLSGEYMDVTNPAVAATQFTAYMALGNIAIVFDQPYNRSLPGPRAASWPTS